MSTGQEKSSDASLLSDEFIHQLVAVGEVDLLVAIPTLNDAATVPHVVQAVQTAFAKHFARERVVLVNADGGSRDGTPEAFKDFAVGGAHGVSAPQMLRTVHRISTVYRGAPEPAAGTRTIIAAADLLRAKACAIVSADLTSINPAWIDNLLRPIYREQFDLVTPQYSRPKFDGLLISNILYPVIRAAYGKRVMEPLATDFAFSGRLASQLLDQDFWRQGGNGVSPEIWITTHALSGDFRVCQSFLGPKVHAEKNSRPDFVGAIRRAVGTLFDCLNFQDSSWLSKTGSESLSAFGLPGEFDLKPVRFNHKRMLEMFRTGVTELASLLQVILAEDTFREIQEISRLPDERIRYSDELWVKTIYDFAGAHHRTVMNRDHIVQALAPLYRGRVGSFVLENNPATQTGLAKATEKLCEEYERLKPYLLERWNAK